MRILYNYCPECDVENPDPFSFLRKFKNDVDTSNFCLAHLVTLIDFPESLAGLAFGGTICSPEFNVGFSTFLNHQVGKFHVKGLFQ